MTIPVEILFAFFGVVMSVFGWLVVRVLARLDSVHRDLVDLMTSHGERLAKLEVVSHQKG